MQRSSQAPVATCRNCAAALSAEPRPLFCPQCGQETDLHPPTLRELAQKFGGHYLATLLLLLFWPGRLTSEYLAGRRRRYVLPLRVYLSASFLFFLVLKLAPVEVLDVPVAPLPSAAASAPPPIEIELDCKKEKCNQFEQAAIDVGERWNADPKAAIERLRERFRATLPYAVFLLLPVFAAIVMLAYRRRRMRYDEHVVFSLHMHSFWFLGLLALTGLPSGWSEAGLLLVAAYGVLALRQVYRGRWRTTLLRAAFISAVYGVVLTLGLAVLTLGLLVVR